MNKMKFRIFIPVICHLIAAITLIYPFANTILAQTPAPGQEKPIVIKASYIHTLTNGTIANGMILIEEGLIKSIGEKIDIPENAIIEDYTGKHVYPGFIHSRSLLGLTEVGAVPVTSDFNELGNINPNVRAEVAFHSASNHIGIAAAYGITIAVATPMPGTIAGLSAAMYTDGWTWEQMIMQAPVGLVIHWPAMLRNPKLEEQLNELQEATDNARRYHKARRNNPNHPIDLRWEAMLGVFDQELPVFIHANELTQIQAAISWAEKEQVRMVLTGGSDAAYLAEQLAEKNIPVILTPIIGSPSRQWEHYGAIYARAAKLHEAGVKFAIAGDQGAAATYRLTHHAAAAVAYGLPQQEALKSITLYPAQLLGLEKRAGSIDAGKEAHLIICTGNPLEFSTVIEQVYILGKKIDLHNKHRQLFQMYQEKRNQTP
jgi:imidazolonepropionase-like amidohydrolase